MNVRHAISTFRGNRVPNFQIIKHRNWWFALSGFFIVLSLVGLFGRGLNYSIAFSGGAQLTYTAKTVPSVADVQGMLAQYGRAQDSQVEIVGNDQVNIRTDTLTTLGPRAQDLREALAKQAGINVDEISEQDVGPTWGSQISRKAIEGLIVFLVLVSIYISFRFEPKMAASALIALAHDLIITAGIYALVGRAGHPGDDHRDPDHPRVFAVRHRRHLRQDQREHRHDRDGRPRNLLGHGQHVVEPDPDAVLEHVAGRAAADRELLLFGGQTLKDFAFALFIGVAAGTYSSIFIAAPLLAC